MLWLICVLTAVAGGAIGAFFSMFTKKEVGTKKLGAFMATLILTTILSGAIGKLNGDLGWPVAVAVPVSLLIFVLVSFD